MELQFRHSMILRITAVLLTLFSILFAGCASTSTVSVPKTNLNVLEKELTDFTSQCQGDVGIAVITSQGDTFTVNNRNHYPLMSVFKLHQALAVAHALDLKGTTFDSIIHISRKELNPNTWSPMMKDFSDENFSLTVYQLLEYTLQQSDNNASNLLFDKIISVAQTDTFIRRATSTNDFKLQYTEREMQANHSLSKLNRSSPLSCVILINKLMTDSLVSDEKQTQIQNILLGCQTGTDRLKHAFESMPEVKLYHKTGSGFRDSEGRLMAHNDIGYVQLPNGTSYAIAVLITNFNGTEAQASQTIATISQKVFDFLSPHLYAPN